MEIAVNILATISIIVGIIYLTKCVRQVERIEKEEESWMAEFARLVAQETKRKYNDRIDPFFLVVKRWYDTGNETTEMVQATTPRVAFLKLTEDGGLNKEYAIVNLIVFK